MMLKLTKIIIDRYRIETLKTINVCYTIGEKYLLRYWYTSSSSLSFRTRLNELTEALVKKRTNEDSIELKCIFSL